ncbi:MAG TPA: 50S ribosomal protein L10 [Planctomycetes bacterium]|nr:50S ribosomal protein L10 [Planctomycetota bacterium]
MPSLINELMLAEVTQVAKGAQAIILIDASKLNAEDAITFRTKLRVSGAKLKVAKAAVIYRVLPAELAKVAPPSGSVGMVCTGEDIAAAAKVINELAKEEKIKLKGGVMEGKALDAKAAKSLADLPTREQANVMLVRVLTSPLVQLVRIANVKPTELVRVLKVKSEEAK